MWVLFAQSLEHSVEFFELAFLLGAVAGLKGVANAMVEVRGEHLGVDGTQERLGAQQLV